MLHHAAVLLRRGSCRKHWLCNSAWSLAAAWHLPPYWDPSHETVVQWLLHHQIAIRVRRDVYVAGPSAVEFASIPARLRVYNVGRLILVREGQTHLKEFNYFPCRTRKLHSEHE